jgi:hypothetical protein
MSQAGRSCPLHYRYSPRVFARDADVHAETIYVIGGLYGNIQALDAVMQLAATEPIAPTLIFNGDFNWFNVDDASFVEVNTRVLQHVALRGNVETELLSTDADAGCGCAYPDYVDEADVTRSNAIMGLLQKTASRHPALAQTLATLPMHLVVDVGGARFGVVHGDAESLAGWRFDTMSIDDAANRAWVSALMESHNLTGFASSHTCLPAFRGLESHGKSRILINNGAAGMPNFAGTHYGLLSRISVLPCPAGLSQYGAQVGAPHGNPVHHSSADIFVDALPLHYDQAAFTKTFLGQWPQGSPAHTSYFSRITKGPSYFPSHALGLMKPAALACAA